MKKLFALLVLLVICSVSFAQSNITMELKDAPVRTSLEMIFKQAGIKSYVIENSVSGVISMNLSEQPFENALKLVMRANTIPLTYTKENDVYIVKSRKIVIGPNPEPTNYSDLIIETKTSIAWEKIHLNYIDSFDLQAVLGNILFINQFSRYTGGMNGMGTGGFGGAGGFGNGAMGGNGGFGMGAGNGMGGGAMGGFGGMMGSQGGFSGNGGFGGGRNF
jgi:hypothetical protein